MMTEEKYGQYTKDFNAACAGDGSGFDSFYDKYYEPDAVFEYIPNATKNVGKDLTVSFWRGVHDMMLEEIKDHVSLLSSDTAVASEASIDFQCRKNLDWVGVKHKAGSSFRLRMAAFYEVGVGGKFNYVRVYSVIMQAIKYKLAGADSTLRGIGVRCARHELRGLDVLPVLFMQHQQLRIGGVQIAGCP